MKLTYDGQTLEFHYDPPGNRTVPSYRTSYSGLCTLRIFIDVGLIEIYADGGRACCTKRIDSPLGVSSIRYRSEYAETIATMFPLQIEADTQVGATALRRLRL